MVIPTLVLYEWLRGPRIAEELAVQEAIVPSSDAIPFGAEEARVASRLYTESKRARGREIDLAIAACAMVWGGALWTLDPADFVDLPDLRLHRG